MLHIRPPERDQERCSTFRNVHCFGPNWICRCVYPVEVDYHESLLLVLLESHPDLWNPKLGKNMSFVLGTD